MTNATPRRSRRQTRQSRLRHTRFRKPAGAAMVVALAGAGIFAFVSQASAYNAVATPTCEGITVGASGYAAPEAAETTMVNATAPTADPTKNSAVITVDGTVIEESTFGTDLPERTYPFLDPTVPHTWQVQITAWDDPDGSKGWTRTDQGESTPCAPPPAPDCAPADQAALHHTFDGTQGDLVIAKDLCDPLFIGGATWTMDDPAAGSPFPQTLEKLDVLEVKAAGTYHFEAPSTDASCVRQNIYATSDRSQLDSLTPGTALAAAQDPIEPTGLHQISEGPGTWLMSNTGACGFVPPEPVELPAVPTVTDPTCEAAGTLTVPESTDQVAFTVAPEFTGAPGEYVVTAAAAPGFVIEGETTWTLTVAGQLPVEECPAPDQPGIEPPAADASEVPVEPVPEADVPAPAPEANAPAPEAEADAPPPAPEANVPPPAPEANVPPPAPEANVPAPAPEANVPAPAPDELAAPAGPGSASESAGSTAPVDPPTTKPTVVVPPGFVRAPTTTTSRPPAVKPPAMPDRPIKPGSGSEEVSPPAETQEVTINGAPEASRPTCTDSGQLLLPANVTQATFEVSPRWQGQPGLYTVTAKPKEGFVIKGDTSWEVRVADVLDSTECQETGTATPPGGAASPNTDDAPRAADVAGDDLPDTGANIQPLIILAAVLLLLGGISVAVGFRRRRT